MHQRRRIFPSVDRSCSQNNCCNYTRKQRLIPHVTAETYGRPEVGISNVIWPGLRAMIWVTSGLCGFCQQEARETSPGRRWARGREKEDNVGHLYLHHKPPRLDVYVCTYRCRGIAPKHKLSFSLFRLSQTFPLPFKVKSR